MSFLKWKMNEPDKKAVKELQTALDVPHLVALTLFNRGVTDPQKGMDYIKSVVYGMNTPYFFRDMPKAVERILKAVENKEAIIIFGDKDVDGMTSTAIVYKTLQKLKANVVYRVPERMEGYGVSRDVIGWAVMNDFSLMITVDCGITAHDEIDYANEMGMDVIITDHHETRDTLPNAYAIINPMIEEDSYPFKRLSGAGVAFKLAQAIQERLELPEYHDEEIVFFDLETSGLNPEQEEIIEIGAVCKKNGVKISEFSEFIRPVKPISGEITQITGITNAMLEEQGGDVAEVLKRFVAYIGDKKCVGHNMVGFDWKFLTYAVKKHLGIKLQNPVEDTLKMSKVQLKKAKNYKLATVGEELGIFVDSSQLHRAVFDSELCAEVYRRLILSRSAALENLNREFLPLAALGTIADIMPLVDENRMIVKNGLELMPYTSVGLISLIREAGFHPGNLTSKQVGWNITPLLNSPGRMGDASLSVELLVCSKAFEARDIAEKIIQKDKERKDKVSDMMELAREIWQKEKTNEDKIAVVLLPQRCKGVNGLIAHRLSSEIQLPTIILSDEGESYTASMRVMGEWNVVDFMESQSELFEQYGGHRYAGGFTIKAEKLPELREKARAYMQDFKKSELKEEIEMDSELSDFSDLTLLNMRYLENIMEPVGNGNQFPLFLVKDVDIAAFRKIGRENSHALMFMEKSGGRISAIAWNMADAIEKTMKEFSSVDIVCSPEIDRFQGAETPRVLIRDFEGRS